MEKQIEVIVERCMDTTCTEGLLALRDSLEILGGKWKLLIALYLDNNRSQNNHFKKMQREIGISAKMLSKELKDLELNQLVTRSVQSTARPITVVYELTEYGRSLIPITKTLVQWGLDHRKKIKS